MLLLPLNVTRRTGAMVARSTPNAEVPGSSPGYDFIFWPFLSHLYIGIHFFPVMDQSQ